MCPPFSLPRFCDLCTDRWVHQYRRCDLLKRSKYNIRMMPSSFFFHQAAEIGLNPSQFLTFIIRTSLQERANAHDKINQYEALLQKLDLQIETLKNESTKRKKIGVLLGGYSYERHISVESGRNIFEKLSSSEKYEPLPTLFIQR